MSMIGDSTLTLLRAGLMSLARQNDYGKRREP